MPTALYGAETQGLREAERMKLDVFEMGCLGSMYGMTLWNRVRNKEVRREETEGKVFARVDQCMLRWFGYAEKMDEERMAKKVMISDVEWKMCGGRARLGWLDGIRMALGKRGMSVEQVRLNVLDRRRWELNVRRE